MTVELHLFAYNAQRHALGCSHEVILTWQQHLHLQHSIGSKYGACAA